jgi:glucose-6-phosphate isomerase
LGRTLAVVISKSGGTKETRNGMVEAATAWTRAGLDFSAHAVAITGLDSELDRHAVAKGWLRRFPMWDWVGGRTSELSAVDCCRPPCKVLTWIACWRAPGPATKSRVNRSRLVTPPRCSRCFGFSLGDGRGGKDMVVLPYKDRLELFSRYLQQLVMESLGKELDLQGKVSIKG